MHLITINLKCYQIFFLLFYQGGILKTFYLASQGAVVTLCKMNELL